jgi:CHASE3 domain sensor protein
VKKYFISMKPRLMQAIGPIIITALAGYSIWYCVDALAPYSELRRMTSLDERLRLSLFQTESSERGYLLTGERDALSSYEFLKEGLLAQLGIFVVELNKQHETEVGRRLDNHVRNRMAEMDLAVAAWEDHDTVRASTIVRANIEQRHTAQICSDLDVISTIEKSRYIR